MSRETLTALGTIGGSLLVGALIGLIIYAIGSYATMSYTELKTKRVPYVINGDTLWLHVDVEVQHE